MGSIREGHKPALLGVRNPSINKVEVIKSLAKERVANRVWDESGGAKSNIGCITLLEPLLSAGKLPAI